MATLKDLLSKMIDKINGVPTKMSELEDDLPVVQPDWNQNDETAVDYVKGRTHYEYEGEVLTEITTKTQASSALKAYDAGKLKAVIKGVEYTEFTFSSDSYSRTLTTADGLYQMSVGYYVDEFYFYPADAVWYVYETGTLIHKLPAKYLPCFDLNVSVISSGLYSLTNLEQMKKVFDNNMTIHAIYIGVASGITFSKEYCFPLIKDCMVISQGSGGVVMGYQYTSYSDTTNKLYFDFDIDDYTSGVLTPISCKLFSPSSNTLVKLYASPF